MEPLLLEYPDADAIRNAYRELPREGMIFLTTKSDRLGETLRALEETGFYGLQINTDDLDLLDLEVAAFKGKQGPCYETGRDATYKGAGLAVLDDDNHLCVGSMRVCEKTGGLWAREPYNEMIEVSAADEDLLKKLELDPIPFDCNTLERDAAELREQVGEPDAGEREPLFYGGPFRVLVLRDGTLMRRGEVTPVPKVMVEELLEQGAKRPPRNVAVKENEFFQKRYDEDGAACLLGDLPLAETFSNSGELRMEALGEVDEPMRQRLRHMIERGDKQFVLTGSDPRNPFGCCPDPQVLSANKLVENGVLSSYRTPTPPDSCPTTLYAMRGELKPMGGKPVVEVDETFRARVAEALKNLGEPAEA
jgi:hypothetical protein